MRLFWGLFIACGLGVGVPFGCRSAPAPEPGSVQVSSPAVSAVPQTKQPAAALDYLEITTGGAEPTAVLPWVIALHGLGDTPEAFQHLFDGFEVPAHVYVARAPLPYGRGSDWFGVRVNGPAPALSEAVRSAAERVHLLRERLGQSPKNSGRPVVTGFSQGGYLSFALAVLHPADVAAALPISGSLPEPLWPNGASAPPLPKIRAFHGARDEIVPLAPTRRLSEALERRGFDITLVEYPDVGHQIPAPVRQDWAAALADALTAR